jgi:WD40 repeat protein
MFRIGTTRFRPGVFIATIAYAPDGKTIVSAATDRYIRFWDAATGKELRSVRTASWAEHVAYSPDGRLLASFCMGKVSLWETDTGKEIRSWKHDGRALAFSADGATLASGGSTLALWDVATGKERLAWPAKSRLNWIAFAPDGKTLVSRAWDQTVRTWDTATGKELHAWQNEGAPGGGTGFDMSRDGKRIASPGKDGAICLYDVATGKKTGTWEAKNRGGAVTFSVDGKLLASVEDSVIRVRLVATGELVCSCPRPRSYFPALAFSPDGKTLAAGEAGCTIRQWEMPSGKEIATPGHDAPVVYSCAFVPGSRTLATVGIDYRVRLWNAGTGQEVRHWDAETTEFSRLQFSPEGRLLAASGDDAKIRLWDVQTGKELQAWNEHAGALAFTPDGKVLISAGLDRTPNRPIRDSIIRTRDVATGKELHSWTVPGYHLNALAVSPDGRALISAGYDSLLNAPVPFRSIRVWDLATGKEVSAARFKRKTADAFRITLSADGKLLASIEGNQVRLWEVATGQEIRAWTMNCSSLTFSPDGRLLAIGDQEGTARLLDVATGAQVWTGQGHRSSVWLLGFSGDGAILASVGPDTSALLWDVSRWSQKQQSPAGALSAEKMNSLWSDMASNDPRQAFAAIHQLAGAGNLAVPFMQERIKPPVGVPAKRLEQLLVDLDSPSFEVRNKASEQLQKLGELAEPALRQALTAQPALELRQRLEKLLEDAPSFRVPAPDQLQALRSVQVLERIGTAAAQEVLQVLARGAQGARLTAEAQAAVDRLEKRR